MFLIKLSSSRKLHGFRFGMEIPRKCCSQFHRENFRNFDFSQFYGAYKFEICQNLPFWQKSELWCTIKSQKIKISKIPAIELCTASLGTSMTNFNLPRLVVSQKNSLLSKKLKIDYFFHNMEFPLLFATCAPWKRP